MGAPMDEPLEVHERLTRHLELMLECHEWALKAMQADEAGQHVLMKRHFKRAESTLKSARALERFSGS
jgi:hypothetical protein